MLLLLENGKNNGRRLEIFLISKPEMLRACFQVGNSMLNWDERAMRGMLCAQP